MKAEFYKMDFRAWNNGTVDLTLEQEAAYLRLCHAMYDNRGPIPSSTRLLQGIFRCGNVKAAALVRQLIEAGKIEQTADGHLSNRRVLQELSDRERLSEVRRSAGGKGGSAPRVSAECTPSDGRVNPECGSSEPPVSGAKSLTENDAVGAIASTVSPQRREEKSISPIVPAGTDPKGFAEFREAYPKRSTAFPTTQARKRWLEAQKRGASPEEIVAGAKAYAAEQARIGKVGTEFIQSADVWLNRQRWQDYATAAVASSESPAPDAYLAGLTDERWRMEVRTWRARRGHWPLRGKTPAPDDPSTKVPPRILAEFGIEHSASATETRFARAS